MAGALFPRKKVLLRYDREPWEKYHWARVLTICMAQDLVEMGGALPFGCGTTAAVFTVAVLLTVLLLLYSSCRTTAVVLLLLYYSCHTTANTILLPLLLYSRSVPRLVYYWCRITCCLTRETCPERHRDAPSSGRPAKRLLAAPGR